MKALIGILGASGYTGYELIRLLSQHPQVEIRFLSAGNSAGQKVGEVFPDLVTLEEMRLITLPEALEVPVNVVFSCLPHRESMEAVPKFLNKNGLKVVDLSADYRIRNPQAYEQWYGKTHASPELLKEAVYGLSELNRETIRKARLVANPGCYPTSVLLGLAPLLKSGWVTDAPILADSKSGLSGAGRNPSLKTHLVEAEGSVAPYSIGRSHRHLVEMEQEMEKLRGKECRLIFSPHLIPMSRGILSTLYVPTKKPVGKAELQDLYEKAFAGEPFVRILKNGKPPETKTVKYSNRCDIGLTCLKDDRMVLIVSAIDNLVKGASGQAIQNMNLMLGLEETLGLPLQGCAN
jgi:N-acetyl-gamma-glutamyl-phosphate reductase